MKHIHNKLVRDNIPIIISTDHKTAKIRTLNDDEYLKYLKLKLIEEAKEVNTTQNNVELKNELADILEVIEAILTFSQISIQEVVKSKENKALKNGKFNKRIFLESVENSNE